MSVCPSILGAKLMMIDFTKMHGAGNDFVVIDAVRKAVNLSANIFKPLLIGTLALAVIRYL